MSLDYKDQIIFEILLSSCIFEQNFPPNIQKLTKMFYIKVHHLKKDRNGVKNLHIFHNPLTKHKSLGYPKEVLKFYGMTTELRD